jgi:hypothetical protein
MESQELLEKCGLASLPVKAEVASWITGKVTFYGAERYVLSSKNAEFQIRPTKEGFTLQPRFSEVAKAEELIGKAVKFCCVHSIEVDIAPWPPIKLHMNSPKKLTRGDVVRI